MQILSIQKMSKSRCLLLLSLALGCIFNSGCGSDGAAQGAGPNYVPARYNGLMQAAAQSAGSDEFPRLGEVCGRIKLSGSKIQNLNRLSVMKSGQLIALDADRKQVEIYDPSGRYVNNIGSYGRGVGRYITPSDVKIGDSRSETIAVSDFNAYRVSFFTKDGTFLRSFVHTPQNFSAQRLLVNQAADSVYLFGNRWEQDSGKITGATMLHKFSYEGKYVHSSLPFPEEAKQLDLYSYDEAAADIGDGNVYVALPFDYTIYRLTKTGELQSYIKGESTEFRKPVTELNIRKDIKNGEEILKDWLTEWTPIRGIAVDGGEFLLVQYQTFNQLRYTIDVYSLKSKKKVKCIRTNHALLTRGDDGYLYFLNNLEAKGQNEYELIKTKLHSS